MRKIFALALALWTGHAGGTTLTSYSWLASKRSQFCSNVNNPPVKFNSNLPYTAVNPGSQANAGERVLIQAFRPQDEIVAVMQSCTLAGNQSTSGSSCSSSINSYLNTLLLAAVPLAVGIIFLLVWNVCCWMAFCRCCRRCCLCSERKVPRLAKAWQKVALVLLVFIGSLATSVAAIVGYLRAASIKAGVGDFICGLVTETDETLNGSAPTPTFLGVTTAITQLNLLGLLLDVDGQSMTDVRGILDETADFAFAMQDLLMKIGHMRLVLSIVNQQKTLDHLCYFCQYAVGNNQTGTQGLLDQLVAQTTASSAEAMQQILSVTSSSLTGAPLASTTAAVRRASSSLQVFRKSFAGVFVDGLVSQSSLISSLGDASFTILLCVAGFCVFHSLVVSTFAVCHARRSQAQYPSATPACITWCCSFFVLCFAMIVGGLMVLVAVPVSELCYFWRNDLTIYQGYQDYYRQLGLYQSVASTQLDQQAVGVYQTCLTANGTGDLLGALHLTGSLVFQQDLDTQFNALNNNIGNTVVDNAKFNLLVSMATNFGGLFVLSPDKPLPLDPSSSAKMLGSSVFPDDRTGPDGRTVVYGLNSYASLIAGPGQYSFQSGTSGGGVIITFTTPTAQSVSSLPVTMQNALVYAREKEQLLAGPNLFRCDTMDSSYRVTQVSCSYSQFASAVVNYANSVRAAASNLATKAKTAQPLVANNLLNALSQVLLQVRNLRTMLSCRFMWARWELVDFSVCNETLPALLEGAVAWIVLSIFELLLCTAHYKIWRHMLDNRLVGEDLDRFSQKYGNVALAIPATSNSVL